MPSEISYAAAFLVGLFGGVHCVGMCGGIVGALGLGLSEQVRGRLGGLLPYLLGYNLGRITSYTAAGTLMGGVGLLAANLIAFHQAQQLLQLIAGGFMIALGFYLGGWWFGLVRLERAGGRLWSRVEPYARRLLPVRSATQAVVMGLVWGWLPCGLVYSALIWAVSAGGPLEGGLLMLSFGLGTLPNLFAMGLFAAQIARFMRKPWVRHLAGASVAVLGVLNVIRAVGL